MLSRSFPSHTCCSSSSSPPRTPASASYRSQQSPPWAPLSENSQATPLDTEPAEPSLVARPSLTRSENCLGEAPSLLPSHSPHCLYRTTSSSSRSVYCDTARSIHSSPYSPESLPSHS